MYSTLETLRNSLAEISGVQTCKIGYESGISPACYPMIRIVPVVSTPGSPYRFRTSEILIYFGDDTTNSQGLELVYQRLFDLEEEILEIVRDQEGRYLETVTDQDRGITAGSPYKLMAIRCELKTPRPGERDRAQQG